MDIIKAIYSDVTAFDGYDDVSKLLDDILDTTSDVVKTDCAISSMVVPYMYGGKQMSNAYVQDNRIVRAMEQYNLSVGDIIIADYRTAQKDGDNYIYDDEGNYVYNIDYYVIYVYVGNNQLVMYTNEATHIKRVDYTTNTTENGITEKKYYASEFYDTEVSTILTMSGTKYGESYADVDEKYEKGEWTTENVTRVRTANHVLCSLFGYSRYAVIRPSMI